MLDPTYGLMNAILAAAQSTVVLVPGKSVIQFNPRLHSDGVEMAVGSEPRGVVERTCLDRDVLRIDVKFGEHRGTATRAEVAVDRFAGIAGARVAGQRTSDRHRRSVDFHIRHERRATFLLTI